MVAWEAAHRPQTVRSVLSEHLQPLDVFRSVECGISDAGHNGSFVSSSGYFDSVHFHGFSARQSPHSVTASAIKQASSAVQHLPPGLSTRNGCRACSRSATFIADSVILAASSSKVSWMLVRPWLHVHCWSCKNQGRRVRALLALAGNVTKELIGAVTDSIKVRNPSLF